VYRNYTNQKRSNVKLASLNHRVSETNHELEFKNSQLSVTLDTLKHTQEQLIETEKQKENALIRGTISQDIHDDISSGLNKICWLAESFMVKTAKVQAPVDMSALEKINAHARDTVSKLGEIIWSSNPERDNLASLLSYMHKYVENYMEDAPIRWRIDFPNEVPDLPLAPDLRRNLYLVMKEALHNARKYSQAQEILVAFRLDSQIYHLEVRDDGIGMTPDLIQGGGDGLNNMRRRMIAIGGQMQFESAAGEGTVVKATGVIA
jgi:signal transduction histidine kinase